MKNLQPVDFKAVAAKGAYVYCYLREDGSPYYVGISKVAKRALVKGKGEIHPPKDAPERVRVMRSSLSYQEAKDWERFYIDRYGRIDLNTGILRNKTAGGEGASQLSAETRQKISEWNKGRKKSPAAVAKQRAKKIGTKATDETRAKLSAARRGKAKSANHKQAISIALTGKKRNTRGWCETTIRNNFLRKSPECSFEQWLAMTKFERVLICKQSKAAAFLGLSLAQYQLMPKGARSIATRQAKALQAAA